MLTASADRSVKLWAESGDCLATICGHGGGVRSAVFSIDAQSVLTASADSTAKVWSLETGRCLQTLAGHSAGLRSASYSADGARALTASYDCTARIWSLQSAPPAQLAQNLEGHAGGVTSAVFSPDDAWALTSSQDCTAKIWSSQTGRCCRTLAGHEDWVSSAQFGASGGPGSGTLRVLTASSDGSALVWDAESGGVARSLCAAERGSSRPGLSSAVFSPHDGERSVLTAAEDGAARLWDVRAPGAAGPALLFPAEASAHGGGGTGARGLSSAVFRADGDQVLTACDDGTAKLWSTRGARRLSTFKGHGSRVSSALFLPETSWSF